MMVPVASHGAGDHRGWIETSLEGGFLVVMPRVAAGHDAQLDYELTSTRSGGAGTATSTQAGSVRVHEGDTRTLTRLRLSVVGEDRYSLVLRVFEGGKLVAEDHVTSP